MLEDFCVGVVGLRAAYCTFDASSSCLVCNGRQPLYSGVWFNCCFCCLITALCPLQITRISEQLSYEEKHGKAKELQDKEAQYQADQDKLAQLKQQEAELDQLAEQGAQQAQQLAQQMEELRQQVSPTGT